MHSILLRSILLTWAAWVALPAAIAQQQPGPTIRLVVPYSAGGPTDVMARVLAKEIRTLSGQSTIVDNRPGAGGSIGSAAVARSEADGNTLVVNGGISHTINPLISEGATGYKHTDFSGVAAFAKSSMVLVAYPGLGAKSVTELVAMAKAKPGAISYASGGLASNPHLAAELFKSVAGIDMVHVPYKGSADSVADMVAGRVPVGFLSPTVAEPLVREKRLVALGVTSRQRLSNWPDVPTLHEQDVAGYEFESWYAVLAPSGTPPKTLEKLSDWINAALRSPEAQKSMAALGLDVMASTPSETDRRIEEELQRWTALIKTQGLQLK